MSDQELNPDTHVEDPTVSDHAALANLDLWQVKAFLARYHAAGVVLNSRLSDSEFQAMLDVALKGRI